MTDPFANFHKTLVTFPDHALRDLARNESTQREYRKAAVEILVNRKSPFSQHPDLRVLVDELEIELEGIQFEFPAPSGNGPLSASITTETMQEDYVELPAPKRQRKKD